MEKLGKNEKFVQFETSATMNPVTKGLNLTSYLIKPIQRICKYPLLLEELLKQTPPNEKDAIDLLTTTNQRIEEVVVYVNEGKRITENLFKIFEIQNAIKGTKVFFFLNIKN